MSFHSSKPDNCVTGLKPPLTPYMPGYTQCLANADFEHLFCRLSIQPQSHNFTLLRFLFGNSVSITHETRLRELLSRWLTPFSHTSDRSLTRTSLSMGVSHSPTFQSFSQPRLLNSSTSQHTPSSFSPLLSPISSLFPFFSFPAFPSSSSSAHPQS